MTVTDLDAQLDTDPEGHTACADCGVPGRDHYGALHDWTATQ